MWQNEEYVVVTHGSGKVGMSSKKKGNTCHVT